MSEPTVHSDTHRPIPRDRPIRALAFYLPQFHPIPENDAWWGAGFTEWVNVVNARPRFRGHYQPRLPAELGFYDLRLAEVREAQADLAKQYGLYGFCYYHYWFEGRRLLERPFSDVLSIGKPDFPFCLCWANQPWTRAWDGATGEWLVSQRYSPEDDVRHLRWLSRAFKDERYVRVGERPLFLVYCASHLPDPQRTARTWREEAAKLQLPDPYLCAVESVEAIDPATIGFDAAVEFQPDWRHLRRPLRHGRLWNALRTLRLSNPVYRYWIHDYEQVVKQMVSRANPDYKRFPGIAPSWDNTPRRETNIVALTGSTPEVYYQWLRRVVGDFAPYGPGEDFVFINAWNEWAEGAVLEPCQRWGRGYLEATVKALAESGMNDMPPASVS